MVWVYHWLVMHDLLQAVDDDVADVGRRPRWEYNRDAAGEVVGCRVAGSAGQENDRFRRCVPGHARVGLIGRVVELCVGAEELPLRLEPRMEYAGGPPFDVLVVG